MNSNPIDVWLQFDSPDDEECNAEANTFINDDMTYRVEWYLNSVGLVTAVYFDTLAEAHVWYAANGFDDYSSGE